jgi:uncharacterized protein YjbJ (UPF0337 family)
VVREYRGETREVQEKAGKVACSKQQQAKGIEKQMEGKCRRQLVTLRMQ